MELPRPQSQDGVCSRTNRTFYPCCRVCRPSRNLAEDRQDSPVVFDAVAIQAAGFLSLRFPVWTTPLSQLYFFARASS